MTETRPPLFRRLPALEGRVPWIPLGRFPTPIEPIRVVWDGGERTIAVKREDLCGEVYGGNKVRKLEFLLAEAKRRGARRLITVGAAGSHHALATAVHGKALGFEVTLVLFPQPLTTHVRDVLLMDAAFGAEIRWAARMEAVPLVMLGAQLAHRRERPFRVAAGGSDAVGTLGWVSAGLELAAQIEAGECERPHTIHVAAGTLGTAAGLALGLDLAGLDIAIVATRITSRFITNERVLAKLVRGAAAIVQRGGVEADPQRALARVTISQGQIGRGYGRETEAALRAAAAFDAAGLRLDGTYTAKAAADLLSAPRDERRLFVHTLSAAEPLDRVDARSTERLPGPVARYLARAGEDVSD